MFFKKPTPLRKFYDLINDSNELIGKGKFDKALVLYPKVKRQYNKLSSNKKENVQNLMDDLERQLILLMKLKESYTLIQNKMFNRVPDTFSRISYILDYLKKNMPNKKRLIEYSETKLSFYKDLYKKEIMNKVKKPENKIKKIKERLIKAREKSKIKKEVKKKIKKKVKTEISKPKKMPKHEIVRNPSELLEENRFEEVRKILKKGF